MRGYNNSAFTSTGWSAELLVQKIREALRCSDPRCRCQRAGSLTHCPAHDDSRPSLSLRARDERIEVRCFAGCPQAAVISALRKRGLWSNPKQKGSEANGFDGPAGLVVAGNKIQISAPKAHEVARKIRAALWRSPVGESFDGKPDGLTFHPDDEWFPGILVSVEGNRVTVDCGASDPHPVVKALEGAGVLPGVMTTRFEIKNAEGNTVAIHVREDLPDGSKRLWWELPDGRPGLSGLRVADLPLYGIHEVGDAREVVVVEGEKARDALKSAGIIAVGTVTGAATTPSDSALRPLVRPGRGVVLWPDADERGRRHMVRIAEALHRLGHRDVYIVEPPENVPQGWDAADAVVEGRDVRTIIDGAVPFKPPVNNGPRLLTARELLEMQDDENADWVVESLLLCGGLSVLAGRPKVGKSTFARALAVAVAQGQPFLGRKVREGPVILVSLEDRLQDVRRALKRLGLQSDDPLYVAVEATMDNVAAWIREHRPLLVIVDTWGRLQKLRDLADYSSVLEATTETLRLAREGGAHVLLVHHAPKQSDGRDPVDAPLGSVSISGTADTILHLKRGPDGVRTLAATQRVGQDLPESVVVLGPDGWPKLAGTKAEVQTGELADAILEFLDTQGEATRAEILSGVQGEAAAKIRALDLLVREGRITRSGTGKRGDPLRFRLAPRGDGPRDDPRPAGSFDSVFPFVDSPANGRTEIKNWLEPAPVLNESRSRDRGVCGGSANGIPTETDPPAPVKSGEGGTAGDLGGGDPEDPSSDPWDPRGEGSGGPEGPGSTSGGGHDDGPERPLEPRDGRGDTKIYPPTESWVSRGNYERRMTVAEPDGTVRLCWDGKEEVVGSGDLDGWTSVEAIPHQDLPEVSTEIPPTLVLDIETTGLNPDQHRVIAVGLALYRDGREEVCEVLRDADERALLSQTFERVAEVAPSGRVLTGYNFLDFDLSFLYMRSQRLRLKCPFWPQRDGRGEVVVRKVAASAGVISSDSIEYVPFKNDLGLHIVDAFHLLARYEFTTRTLGAHKDLKSVAEDFGVAEPDRVLIPHDKISEATPEELERYVQGDLRETYRVYERLVKPYLVISRLTLLPLEDIVTRSTAWIWQSVLERHYGRTEDPDEKEDYPGGLVVSRPGLYYPCVKLDVASLYPTVMLAYKIRSRKDTQNVALSWLRSLTEMRLRLKKRAKRGDQEAKVVQEGLKVLLNSLYGFYGTGGYGFNDMHAARRVTELGRKILVKMIAAIEDAGGAVVEADTDGVVARAHDPQQILAAAQQALPQPFRVDVEWTDSVVFVSDRKNYIVLDKEGGVITAKGAKWRGRDKEAIWTKFPREFLRRWILQDRDAAMEYAKEIEGEITSGRGWDWVTRTHRVSASDKYLLEAGFNEGEVATYTYKDKRRRIVSRSPHDGYDAAHYAKMLRIVVQEITAVIGRA